ncbi:S8 family serine peptidase, partial [Aquiluna sp.]
MHLQLGAAFISLALLTTSLSATEQWWLSDLGPEVGTASAGQGVVIAVIDTGIDASHPDLEGVVIGGTDFSGVGSADGLSPVGSSSYHGTMVASLIVGQGNKSGGVIGVAPAAKLLSISVGLGIQGSNTDAQIADAVNWAVDQGADVINLSLSRNSANWPTSWDAAFLRAFQNDIVIIAASGNDISGDSEPGAPATIPGVISVTGLDKNHQGQEVAGSSGIGVSLSAPGVHLFGSYPGGQIAKWSG